MPDTRILVLGDENGDLLRSLSRPGVELTHTPDVDTVIGLAPDQDVVVLDIAGGFRAIAELCRAFREEPALSAVPILCVSTSDDVEERILLLEAGADDVISRPFDDRELDARIEALRLRSERSRDLTPPSAPVELTKRAGKRSILVYSPKGGVGTTTVAVNLGVVLAGRMPDAVAILDLAAPLGQVTTHLNITPRQTLVDVLHDSASLREPELLRSASERHASGLHVLAAPATLAPGPMVPAAQLETLLDTALRAWSTIVIDAGSSLDESVLTALSHADDVVLLLTPDFPAIKAIHGLLEYLDATGAPLTNPTFVLNEAWPREVLRQADIEEALGTRITARLPYDPFLYLRAVNEGSPVVTLAPRSAPAERFERLVRILVAEAEPDTSDGTGRPKGLAGLFRRG